VLAPAGSDEAVFFGEATRRRSRVNAHLAIDGAHVRIDRADTHHELLGHLCIGEPDGDQSKDIHLASRQACRILPRVGVARRPCASRGRRIGGGVEPSRLRDALEPLLAAIGEGQPSFALAPIRLAMCSAMPRILPSTFSTSPV
jgi:hypothetical protein